MENNHDNQEKSYVKFSEKFSLRVRKTIIVSKIFTLLLVVVLISGFVGLNMWVSTLELPEIDVTKNKIYTLSDTSKKALESINQDIKIYLFGIDEGDSVVGLVKQYCQANSKIQYEMLTRENNLAKVEEFELEDGYSIVVIESGNSKKIIDASSEFTSYDYSTYQEVDITEQTLTNSILNLSNENKPTVYFTEGHEEFSDKELGTLEVYLTNEAIEYKRINLMTVSSIPEDCDVLAIISPSTDFLENETQYVIDYINRGGNLFITSDVDTQNVQYPNLQKILDLYGVKFVNGYALESDSNNTVANYPYVFKPQVSESNPITEDISTDSFMWLAYAEKIEFLSDGELQNLKVTHDDLLTTGDNAYFITDFTSDAITASSTAQNGKFVIASSVTKTISEDTESTEQDSSEGEETSKAIESKLVILGNGRCFTDYVVSEISAQYPMSYLGSNKDFAINSIGYLAEKENGLTIRKDMSGTSYVYTASEKQNRIVLAIIFVIPVVILLIGIIIWKYRKKRK